MTTMRPHALVAGGLALLAGCSTVGGVVRREDAPRTEAVLAAAGFQIEPGDTPERIAEIDEMPHFKIVTRRDGPETIYAYADPAKCHCEYVGGAEQHAEYERLRAEQRLAYERQEAQRIEDEMMLDTDARPARW